MIDISRTPGQRHLQRARDRRRGQRQHVDVGAQLLQPLLVLDAEVLLLVDDEQAEVAEPDLLWPAARGCRRRCRPGRLARPSRVSAASLAGDQARQLPHDRPASRWKRSLKVWKCWRASSVVGHDDGHLLAGHGHDEGGAQRHLGLAEADVAADQPVHRRARAEVVQHVVDGVQLVVGLLIGEAGAELVEQARRRRRSSPVARSALGGDA